MKKHLSRTEEFEIMRLVLDKFLWLCVFILALGFYLVVTSTQSFAFSFSIMLAGIVLLVVFTVILVREYEFMK